MSYNDRNAPERDRHNDLRKDNRGRKRDRWGTDHKDQPNNKQTTPKRDRQNDLRKNDRDRKLIPKRTPSLVWNFKKFNTATYMSFDGLVGIVNTESHSIRFDTRSIVSA
jgi:hypothetical protein